MYIERCPETRQCDVALPIPDDFPLEDLTVDSLLNLMYTSAEFSYVDEGPLPDRDTSVVGAAMQTALGTIKRSYEMYESAKAASQKKKEKDRRQTAARKLAQNFSVDGGVVTGAHIAEEMRNAEGAGENNGTWRLPSEAGNRPPKAPRRFNIEGEVAPKRPKVADDEDDDGESLGAEHDDEDEDEGDVGSLEDFIDDRSEVSEMSAE